jgi:hypothetical protein
MSLGVGQWYETASTEAEVAEQEGLIAVTITDDPEIPISI